MTTTYRDEARRLAIGDAVRAGLTDNEIDAYLDADRRLYDLDQLMEHQGLTPAESLEYSALCRLQEARLGVGAAVYGLNREETARHWQAAQALTEAML